MISLSVCRKDPSFGCWVMLFPVVAACLRGASRVSDAEKEDVTRSSVPTVKNLRLIYFVRTYISMSPINHNNRN
jgi:hypothetical protein